MAEMDRSNVTVVSSQLENVEEKETKEEVNGEGVMGVLSEGELSVVSLCMLTHACSCWFA